MNIPRTGADTTRLDWLEAHPNVEISFDGYSGEDEPWRAHRITGGYNDREWNLIATGETYRDCIDAARRAMKGR